MNFKKEILTYYQLKEAQKLEITKLINKFEKVTNKGVLMYTDFLDPFILSVAEDIMTKYYSEIECTINGGYENSERKILVIYPQYYDMKLEDLPIKVITIKGIKGTSHRSVLGSILGLGLKREKIGDIIINDELIQVIVTSDIAEFIYLNLSHIGSCKVNSSISNINELVPPIEKYKFISSTVQSLRLDAIGSVGFKESRNNVASDIKKNKLKVNYKPIDSPSFNIKEGDMISYRSKGRIVIEQILGISKKNRTKIIIKKFQ